MGSRTNDTDHDPSPFVPHLEDADAASLHKSESGVPTRNQTRSVQTDANHFQRWIGGEPSAEPTEIALGGA